MGQWLQFSAVFLFHLVLYFIEVFIFRLSRFLHSTQGGLYLQTNPTPPFFNGVFTVSFCERNSYRCSFTRCSPSRCGYIFWLYAFQLPQTTINKAQACSHAYIHSCHFPVLSLQRLISNSILSQQAILGSSYLYQLCCSLFLELVAFLLPVGKVRVWHMLLFSR